MLLKFDIDCPCDLEKIPLPSSLPPNVYHPLFCLESNEEEGGWEGSSFRAFRVDESEAECSFKQRVSCMDVASTYHC